MADTVNRVDHFIWVVRPENIKKYTEELSAVLGVEFEHRDGPNIDGSNIDVYLSWDSGLELVAPLTAEDVKDATLTEHPAAEAFFRHLADHGEGPYAVVFRVPDLQKASDRARQLGYPVKELHANSSREVRMKTHQAWTHKVVDNQETNIGLFLNTMLMLAQTEYPGDT